MDAKVHVLQKELNEAREKLDKQHPEKVQDIERARCLSWVSFSVLQEPLASRRHQLVINGIASGKDP